MKKNKGAIKNEDQKCFDLGMWVIKQIILIFIRLTVFLIFVIEGRESQISYFMLYWKGNGLKNSSTFEFLFLEILS